MDSEEIARLAKTAFQDSQLLPSSERISALLAIRSQLELRKSDILAANIEDLKVCVCVQTLFFPFIVTEYHRLLKPKWMLVGCPNPC